MRDEKICRRKVNFGKRDLQSINKLNYYKHCLFPSIFETSEYPTQQYCSIKANYIENTYNYIHQLSVGPEQLNENSFIQLIKPIYFEGNAVNIGQNSFTKQTQIKSSILPICKKIRQNIVIFTLKQQIQRQNDSKYETKSPYDLNSINKNKKSLSKQISMPAFRIEKQQSFRNFTLYIVHHCIPSQQYSQLRWEHFAQSYRVSFQNIEGIVKSIIRYQVSFSYHYKSLITLLDRYMNYLQLFFQQTIYCSLQKKQLKYLEKIALQLKVMNRAKRIKQIKNQQNPSFDEIHRRQLKLKSQQIKVFNQLKIKTFAYFSSINREKNTNRYFLQNLTCRMMENNDYKSDQSWQAIKYYLDFEKRMRKKYHWNDFKKYQNMNLFKYIGKDKMGRPVLFNILRNALCSKIENFDQFFDYHFFLFEIYMQDQMQGWVDQFLVIADASNQVSDNTNLGFTKRIITQALKLSIGRTFKIVVYDVNLIGKTLYRILKSFMPERFFDTLRIFGDEKEQLLKQIEPYISENVIPSSIGGKNNINLYDLNDVKNETAFTNRTPVKKVTSYKRF